MTTQSLMDDIIADKKQCVQYAGNILDTTISGSRSGLNVLLVYNALIYGLRLDKSHKKLTQFVVEDLKQTKYFYRKMLEIFDKNEVLCFPGQFNVLFPKPTKEIIEKYQLMISGQKAVVCINHNVNRQ